MPQGAPADRFETIRGAVGSFRRSPLGSDRDGRSYWALGERFDVLWCRSASGAWSFCSDVQEFKALVESLGRTDDEKRLKRVLLKLAPIFERILGLTGVACSLCGAAPPNGQLLLCDGTDCAEEPRHRCFACGGVTCVPDGDWRCRGCVSVPLEVASQKWAQCDACGKWRRLPSHIVLRKLPARWTCDMNVWDADRASCDASPSRGPTGRRSGRAAAGSSLTGVGKFVSVFITQWS